MAASTSQKPRCKSLVLDAGPLLSLSPLRGVAETYFTTPQVLAELKDPRAREHFQRLGLSAGVKVEVRQPDATSMTQVIQWAKKTGDYSVLSHTDLGVIALTHSLAEKEKSLAANAQRQDEGAIDVSEQLQDLSIDDSETNASQSDQPEHAGGNDDVPAQEDLEPLDVELQPVESEALGDKIPPITSTDDANEPIFDDPSDSDDGEGEWITPVNVALHKSRALHLLPDEDKKTGKGRKQEETVAVGCMTADFAMQNVILQMGLSLVGVEGKRIQRVKNWVLRCHACFKICKDSSRQFCPSCGNPTLLRASVTIAAPNAASDAPVMQVHLKSNFQYKIRGTKFSIPAPKPGSAKKGTGEGLILREDQTEYVRAKQRADNKRERENRKLTKGIFDKGNGAGVAAVGSWMDPDWVPEILSVGTGGKGRSIKGSNDMPTIGYGKKNPNQVRKK
ncbi:Nin1 binding protein [Pleurotus ostreatus]|uniref:20S-pre-rRNA D-site endonuclease NOB1 n=1 Tax=Pleurotus ostreatus TaxID=5322 RepID=A0A8H7DV01_PLEOS|nr:Nin1 binding protein [Pleurotus ostreatus]KAF7432895.1 Nin1 binding protein [Pleurotus ostreatus]